MLGRFIPTHWVLLLSFLGLLLPVQLSFAFDFVVTGILFMPYTMFISIALLSVFIVHLAVYWADGLEGSNMSRGRR